MNLRRKRPLLIAIDHAHADNEGSAKRGVRKEMNKSTERPPESHMYKTASSPIQVHQPAQVRSIALQVPLSLPSILTTKQVPLLCRECSTNTKDQVYRTRIAAQLEHTVRSHPPIPPYKGCSAYRMQPQKTSTRRQLSR